MNGRSTKVTIISSYASISNLKGIQRLKNLPIFIFIAFILSYASLSVSAPDSKPSLIVYESKTQSTSTSGSNASSRSRSSIVERIIGNKGDGLEIEFSFPNPKIPENDAWKLPARVVVNPDGAIELLNESEIEDRLEKYLEKHPEMRKFCGGAVFTWTVFEIHCDTVHIIDLVKSNNLHLGTLSEGKLYTEPEAIGPSRLRNISSNDSKQVLEVELVLDPTQLQSKYEKDMEKIAEITGDNVNSLMNTTLNLNGDEKPLFSGQRLVSFELDPNGKISKIQRETTTIIKGGGMFQETTKLTETLERQPIE